MESPFLKFNSRELNIELSISALIQEDKYIFIRKAWVSE